jgi:Collagen triple helix repeat (20 copies)
MRSRLTYANVTATLALVLAMSGGAYAANRYLINSTRQINPKVLRKLRGARGEVGPNGVVGPQGVTGEEGARGPRGPQGEPGLSALSTLPHGQSESGDFTIQSAAAPKEALVSGSITFSVPLATPIVAANVDVRTVGSPDSTCAGPGSAAHGWLCVYTSASENLEAKPKTFDPEAASPTEGTGRFGVEMRWKTLTEGGARVSGTYTVTAG